MLSQVVITCKGQMSWFKRFLKVDEAVLETFTQLSRIEELHDDVPAPLERYVYQVYALGASVNDIPLLRWCPFSKKQAEGEKLLPTRAAPLQKVRRGQYQNDLVSQPNLPTLTSYG